MINFGIEKIAPLCQEFGVVLNDEKIKKLNLYGSLLLEWNEKMNLTAISEPEEVLFKHFYDCILLLKHCEIPQNSTLVDVGTGAGFPGMVLKIVRDDLDITLLDSLNKRLVFLNEVISKLGLEKIKTVHSRAEEAGMNKAFREKFDFATARAVAALPVLLEYCTPLLKVGGTFVSMKGPSVFEEAEKSANAIKTLGVKKINIICETLTGNEERAFALFKKISQTPPKYPRKPANISKQPL
ncbi:MAG: 16S rRNA (guanine(527)-N(7))-methyltransferase RsmG [Ruminococcaceae bacterium]|nr:16S rRNA (guanine(527)-N(7))-methyltransferase RsmG [Oscillospiraceae bacterium]